MTGETLKILIDGGAQFLAFLRKRLADPEAAEDLLQQCFVRALKVGDAAPGEASTVAWFYRVLQNALIDFYRHRGAEKRKIDAAELDAIAAQDYPLPEELRHDICRCMNRLLPSLHPAYAEIVRRVDLQEERPGDVAAALGLTKNNLTVRLHRGRQALKQSLQRTCGACADHGCLDCHCKHPPASL